MKRLSAVILAAGLAAGSAFAQQASKPADTKQTQTSKKHKGHHKKGTTSQKTAASTAQVKPASK